MLKKTITYTDYNDVERTETFYFNLTKAELSMMEMKEAGGLGEKIQRIVDSRNVPEIMELFESIIKLSYGEKSPDGKRFIKSPEISEAFSQTEAYSDLFMELLNDSEKAANFIKEILPKNLDQ